MSSAICTADGFWRCDGSWPMTEDDCAIGVCDADYRAPWSEVGMGLPLCSEALVPDRGIPPSPAMSDIWWYFVDPPGNRIDGSSFGPIDVSLTGTWLGAQPGVDAGAPATLRVNLELAGVARELVVALDEQDVALPAPGTAIVVRQKGGVLSVELAADGALVFAIAGTWSEESTAPFRSWTLGPFAVSTGDGYCAFEALGCNWRYVINRLLVEWGGGSRSLAPGESAVLDVAGVRYAVNFDYTWHRADAFEGPGCGSIEFDDDRFTLVRVP